MGTYSRGEMALEILKLLAGGALLVGVLLLPGAAPILKLVSGQTSQDRHRIKQAFERLQKKGYVRRVTKNKKAYIEITKKGAKYAATKSLEELKIKPQKKWKGKWWVVAFDIPESKRKNRLRLSQLLGNIGCYRLQKSLYVSLYPLKDEVTEITESLGIRSRVIIFEVSSFDDEYKVLKKYGIA